MREPVRLCLNDLHRQRVCNEVLRLARMPDGSTQYLCQRCNWREAGRCWQCGEPRTNDLRVGVFCAPCGVASRKAACKRWHQDAREQKRAYDAARWANGTAQPNRPRRAKDAK